MIPKIWIEIGMVGVFVLSFVLLFSWAVEDSDDE